MQPWRGGVLEQAGDGDDRSAVGADERCAALAERFGGGADDRRVLADVDGHRRGEPGWEAAQRAQGEPQRLAGAGVGGCGGADRPVGRERQVEAEDVR